MQQLTEEMVSNEIKKLVPVLGKENSRRLSRAYLMGDEETRNRIVELVDVLKAAVASNKDLRDAILMEPPPRDVATDGDIELGYVLYGRKKLYPIRLKERDFLTHVGIFGSSGYGKTNISYWIIEKMAERGLPVLVFDFSKRNYKELLSTPLADRVDIYTVGRKVSPFKFNPLKPPEGVLLSQWMKEFSGIFDHAYWLLGGGRHIILKALDNVFMQKKKPRLMDLKNWINDYGKESLPVRERNWLATAARPLESLCFKEVGDVFDCDTGIKPSEFFRKGRVTVLELDALDTNDRTFFIEIILQWIRDWLLVSGSREKLRGIIILEEAHHVLNREKASKLGSETVIELVFREVRELGMGMVYIDQHPSLVSYPALGNTSTHIYMNLGLATKHASDIQDAGNMLGLPEEDMGNIRKLSIGEGFMLCRMSDFHEPFLVRFPRVDIEKGSVTDDDIRAHMVGRIPVVKEEKEQVARESEAILPEEIDSSGWKIIKVIGTSRGVFASQIYSELKMSGSAFKNKVKKLIDLGAVGMSAGKIKKNRLKYYFLTDMGLAAFEKKFGKMERPERKIDSGLMGEMMELFKTAGWKPARSGDLITLEGEDKKLDIVLAEGFDRDRMLEHLERGRKHFLCSGPGTENFVIQQAARQCYETGKSLEIFVSTVKEFLEKGSFEKVEFL